MNKSTFEAEFRKLVNLHAPKDEGLLDRYEAYADSLERNFDDEVDYEAQLDYADDALANF